MAKRLFSVVAILAGIGMAVPAAAQFGGIFGESPAPRPPGDVPGGRTLPPPDPSVVPQGRLPPGPPPGRGTIQTQPLPPPPGSARSPDPAMPPPGQPQQSASPPGQAVQPAPGQPGSPTGKPQQGQPQQAQPQPGQPPQGEPGRQAALPRPGQEILVEPPQQKIANPLAVFSGLDKITGRITEFEVEIGETVRFGALEVTPRVCYSRPPTETQLTDGFIEVDELTLQGELKRIFTGWMFVSSPGLNAVEHPIYDVWLTDCKGPDKPAPEQQQPEVASETPELAPSAAPSAARTAIATSTTDRREQQDRWRRAWCSR